MKKYFILAAMVLALMLTATACGKENSTPGASVFSPTPAAGTSGTEGEQSTLLADTNPIKEIVTVGKYKGIEVTPLELTVTDEEVEKELHLSLAEHAVTPDRNLVWVYDTANIDFEGKVDGVAFEGGTAEGYDLLIGSGNFIPGFEDGLLGAEVGTTIDLPVVFPENYGKPELAGKPAIFTVTINSIKALPELTDAFIAEKTDFDTLDAYEEDIRATLQRGYDVTIESQFETDVVAAIIDNSEFHMDLSTEINAYANNMKSMYEYQASMYGVSLEVYINAMFGMTMDAFNTEMPKSAEQLVKRYYIMLAIADAEGMTVSEAEYNDYAEQMMVDYGFETIEQLEAEYPKSNLENSILYERAFNLVLENAVRK